jgi:hypothetical protein
VHEPACARRRARARAWLLQWQQVAAGAHVLVTALGEGCCIPEPVAPTLSILKQRREDTIWHMGPPVWSGNDRATPPQLASGASCPAPVCLMPVPQDVVGRVSEDRPKDKHEVSLVVQGGYTTVR